MRSADSNCVFLINWGFFFSSTCKASFQDLCVLLQCDVPIHLTDHTYWIRRRISERQEEGFRDAPSAWPCIKCPCCRYDQVRYLDLNLQGRDQIVHSLLFLWRITFKLNFSVADEKFFLKPCKKLNRRNLSRVFCFDSVVFCSSSDVHFYCLVKL